MIRRTSLQSAPLARKARGFTLIEAMVVVSILGILAAIAAPNLSTFIATMHSKSVAQDLVGDLALARSEAIKRNEPVTIAPIDGSWVKGWEITDPAGNVLGRHDALKYSLNLTGTSSSSGATFQPNGRLAADNAPNNLNWLISSTAAGVTSRCVVITPTGSARSKTGACS